MSNIFPECMAPCKVRELLRTKMSSYDRVKKKTAIVMAACASMHHAKEAPFLHETGDKDRNSPETATIPLLGKKMEPYTKSESVIPTATCANIYHAEEHKAPLHEIRSQSTNGGANLDTTTRSEYQSGTGSDLLGWWNIHMMREIPNNADTTIDAEAAERWRSSARTNVKSWVMNELLQVKVFSAQNGSGKEELTCEWDSMDFQGEKSVQQFKLLKQVDADDDDCVSYTIHLEGEDATKNILGRQLASSKLTIQRRVQKRQPSIADVIKGTSSTSNEEIITWDVSGDDEVNKMMWTRTLPFRTLEHTSSEVNIFSEDPGRNVVEIDARGDIKISVYLPIRDAMSYCGPTIKRITESNGKLVVFYEVFFRRTGGRGGACWYRPTQSRHVVSVAKPRHNLDLKDVKFQKKTVYESARQSPNKMIRFHILNDLLPGEESQQVGSFTRKAGYAEFVKAIDEVIQELKLQTVISEHEINDRSSFSTTVRIHLNNKLHWDKKEIERNIIERMQEKFVGNPKPNYDEWTLVIDSGDYDADEWETKILGRAVGVPSRVSLSFGMGSEQFYSTVDGKEPEDGGDSSSAVDGKVPEDGGDSSST